MTAIVASTGGITMHGIGPTYEWGCRDKKQTFAHFKTISNHRELEYSCYHYQRFGI